MKELIISLLVLTIIFYGVLYPKIKSDNEDIDIEVNRFRKRNKQHFK